MYCAGDNYVQMILRTCLPLAENTHECTIPRKMLGDQLPVVLIWYRTVIEELQRISQEVCFLISNHNGMCDASITPEGQIKMEFFCYRLDLNVRLSHLLYLLFLHILFTGIVLMGACTTELAR